MALTPYVVGQWVRGDRFYGRGELVREVLDGNRNCLWLLGTRRIGKTSILKHLEQVVTAETPPRYFPLYWDFQGCEEEADLHEGFGDALLDAFPRLDELGIDLDAVDDDDLFAAMAKLRRELAARQLSLLLLGDEVEELVAIYETAPRFLRRLRRALQSPENVRTVFASTIRLWQLAYEEATTSPLLNGFTPPLVVGGLDPEASRALIRQSKLPAAARPAIDDATVEAIRRRTDDHPYLMQLLAERYAEAGDLERASDEIAADEMVGFFFASDLAMLSDAERRILAAVLDADTGTGDGVSSRAVERRLGDDGWTLDPASVESGLHRLRQLGFLARSEAGDYSLPNPFFRRWLAGLSHGAAGPPAAGPPAADAAPTRVAPAERTLETAADASGRRVVDDRYVLLDHLGSGASGDVHKAHDRLLDSVVALKLLRLDGGLEEEAVERLRREVLLARDVGHPNIVRIYHLGEAAGQRYITMQYLAGKDLAQLLAARRRLPVGLAVSIAGKLASALAALHGADVLHRDLKPANVLLDESGEPHITDFGLARLRSGPGITRNMFLGSPAYASPEQALGRPLDARSDLYALGVLLFEMVAGRRPFVADSFHELLGLHLKATPPSPRDLEPAVPEALAALILRCLEKEPDRRPRSAADLELALASLRLRDSQVG